MTEPMSRRQFLANLPPLSSPVLAVQETPDPAEKLFGVLLVGTIGAFLLWSLFSIVIEAYWSWRLACDGVPATATVLDYQAEKVTHRSRRGGTHTHVFHMHQVSFAERVATVRLDNKHPVDAQVPVLYLPEGKGIAAAAGPGASACTIFRSRVHGHTFLWLLLWVKLIVVTLLGFLGWLFPGSRTQDAAGGLIDSAAQAVGAAISSE